MKSHYDYFVFQSFISNQEVWQKPSDLQKNIGSITLILPNIILIFHSLFPNFYPAVCFFLFLSTRPQANLMGTNTFSLDHRLKTFEFKVAFLFSQQKYWPCQVRSPPIESASPALGSRTDSCLDPRHGPGPPVMADHCPLAALPVLRIGARRRGAPTELLGVATNRATLP